MAVKSIRTGRGNLVQFASLKCPFSRELRMMYLESKLFLTGEYFTGMLVELGISETQATEDLRIYKNKIHDGISPIHYCTTRKRHILDGRFKPRLVKREKMAELVRTLEHLFAETQRVYQITNREKI